MSIFNLTDEKMKETSSTFTAHEIYQQPATWRKTCAQLAGCKDELQAFIDQVVKQDDFDIVLVGAGTSEFVGNSLFQALNPKYNYLKGLSVEYKGKKYPSFLFRKGRPVPEFRRYLQIEKLFIS